MALDGILSSGLSSILTNSAALRVTSDNIANVNTPGYVRRVVQQQTLAPGGQLAGVQLGNVQRITDAYIDNEVLNANSSSSQYDVQSTTMDQFNAALGQPGDGASIGSQLDAMYSALGQASLSPNSLASREGALSDFQSLAQTISGLATSVESLRQSTDGQVGSAVTQANTLIQQIYALNPQIQHATITGDTASGLLDQRDSLVQQLSQLMGVKTTTQSDGRMFISTTDGVSLVGDNYAQLNYTPSAGPNFNPVTVQTISGATGQPVGTPQTLDSHVTSGQLRGLLDMRDGTLVDIGDELGSLAKTVSSSLNAVHNAGSAVPPPTSLDGRQTGLLSTDALNFTGATTIGITDSNGNLLHKVTVNFDSGTLSVDGGAAASIGATVGSFSTALNTALGANGSADFTNGALTISATGSNGVVVSDDSTNPTSRGGVAFSQYFGLNDLFRTGGNSISTTGLSASDTGGFAAGGNMTLSLQGPQGQMLNQTTVSVTGTTIGDMVSALNTAFAGNATFALDSNGQLQMTPSAANAGYTLNVTQDTTQRGGTGESFSTLFGLGATQSMALAQTFSLSPNVAGSPQSLAFAQPTLAASTALGTTVVAPGDNSGLLALQNALTAPQNFTAAGDLPARSVSLTDYAAAFYQDVASRGSAISDSKSAQDTRLTLAQQAQSKTEGVNLDQELENMMVLQQAYSAGSRLLTVSQQLYTQLLNAVTS